MSGQLTGASAEVPGTEHGGSAAAEQAASAASPPARDPMSVLRDSGYRRLLVLATIVGVVVSVASWAFLEAVHYSQVWVFEDLPGELGLSHVPTWWPLPWLALGGILVAFAIVRLPGRGGHEPSKGLTVRPPTTPIMVPGVMLAAFATLAFGLVLVHCLSNTLTCDDRWDRVRAWLR